MKIAFRVIGQAIPAGSKRAVPVYNRRTGKPLTSSSGRIVTRVLHDNPKLGDWMRDVKCAASQAYSGPLLEGPVSLEVTVYRTRPRSHYRTGRNAGLLRASAPDAPSTKPDLTKLVRGIEDGLTGVLWRDDAQVCQLVARKCWGERSEVHVVVTGLPPEKTG